MQERAYPLAIVPFIFIYLFILFFCPYNKLHRLYNLYQIFAIDVSRKSNATLFFTFHLFKSFENQEILITGNPHHGCTYICHKFGMETGNVLVL